jgi:hypothetical protein
VGKSWGGGVEQGCKDADGGCISEARQICRAPDSSPLGRTHINESQLPSCKLELHRKSYFPRRLHNFVYMVPLLGSSRSHCI